MFGYSISCGYKGMVYGKWMLFATESEYYEYMRELDDKGGAS